ncbi:MAG TPA: site-specific integrase [Ignavibacteria bacterium]
MKSPFYRKTGNGKYYIYYYVDENRKSISTKTRNGKKAESIFNKFLNGDFVPTQQKFILCSQLFKEYLEISVPPIKTLNSYKTIKYSCDDFIRILGDKLISNYTTKDIDTFLTKKMKSCSVHTVKKLQRTIKAIFNQAIKWKYLKRNPFEDSQKITLPEIDLIYFIKEEFKKLIANTDSELYKDIFTFAVLTGLRINELINLRLEDININKKQIRVLSNESHRTKSGKTRFVDLANSLIQLVAKYKDKGQIYLFESYISKTKLYQRVVQEMTKKYIIKAGLNNKLSFHNFRKTFGKWLLDEGVDLKYISQQLGHSSVLVTEKHYAKFLKAEYKGYINKINL